MKVSRKKKKDGSEREEDKVRGAKVGRGQRRRKITWSLSIHLLFTYYSKSNAIFFLKQQNKNKGNGLNGKKSFPRGLKK